MNPTTQTGSRKARQTREGCAWTAFGFAGMVAAHAMGKPVPLEIYWAYLAAITGVSGWFFVANGTEHKQKAEVEKAKAQQKHPEIEPTP